MEQIIETHQFGPHHVVVVEHIGNDEKAYSILVDNVTVTGPPLADAPTFEDIVHFYARTVGSS